MFPKEFNSFMKRAKDSKTQKTLEKIMTEIEPYSPPQIVTALEDIEASKIEPYVPPSQIIITLEDIEESKFIAGIINDMVTKIVMEETSSNCETEIESVSEASTLETETTEICEYIKQPTDEVDDDMPEDCEQECEIPDANMLVERDIDSMVLNAIAKIKREEERSQEYHYNLLWHKYTGAQERMFRKRLPGEVSIKTETLVEGHENKHLYSSCTPENLIELSKTNIHLFEIITDYPCKVFFDIDFDSINMFTVHFPAFIEEIKTIISGYFPNSVFAISGSATPNKFSLHVTLTNYLLYSAQDMSILKSLMAVMKKQHKSFDEKVYSKNRAMKCINQSKPTKLEKRIQKIIENDDPRAHMITCFFDVDKCLPFPTFDIETAVKIKLNTLKQKFDVATLPKTRLLLPTDIEHVIDFTPTTYLSLLPISSRPEHNHRYTHTIAKFCHSNGIGFEEFWSWIEKKHIEKNNNLDSEKRRWVYTWDKLDQFREVTPYTIHAILSASYPQLSKNYHFTQFMLTFRLTNTIKVENLDPSLIATSTKNAIFWAGMGSGKTFMTSKYLAENPNKSFLWICPNRALVSNVYKRLIDDGVDVQNYQNVKKKHSLHKSNSLIICLNSLHYLNSRDSYDIIVIDEIETFLNKFVDNDFIGTSTKLEIWKELLKFLNNANKVILLDAFITKKTVDFCSKISGRTTLYECTKKTVERTIIIKQHFRGVCNQIITDLKAGKKLFIFYPYKSKCQGFPSMETFRENLERETGARGISINADKDDAELKQIEDVNTHWKDLNFVMTNNKITVGVNYDNTDFDKVFLFVAPFNLARDIMQVSCRARHLNENTITLCYVGGNRSCSSWKTDVNCFGGCTIYSSLIHNILTELKSPLHESLHLFSRSANYKTINDTEVIIDSVDKYITKLFKNTSVTYKYTNIEDIDNSEANDIDNKIQSQEATMHEKMCHAKYFFNMMFKEEAKDIIYDADQEEPVTFLAHAWDKHDQCVIRRFKQLIHNPESLFNKIAKFNNFREDQIIPEHEGQMKLNDELIEQIFKEQSFKYLKKDSSHKLILKTAYNTHFGKDMINTCKEATKEDIYQGLYTTEADSPHARNVRLLVFREYFNDLYKFFKTNYRETDNELIDICLIPKKMKN
jgi:hypothetical protein